MGVHDVHTEIDHEALRSFTRHLIRDVDALQYMLNEGMFDAGARRIGAEQELFLVDDQWQPAPLAEEVLALNDDPRLVTELTRFNLEFNLDPFVFAGDCLSQMERGIEEVLSHTRRLAHQLGGRIVLTGILPTIHASDLGLNNMSPKPRYFALNDVIMRLRGGQAQFAIRGTDELFFEHDTILAEGCNTSFQLHFQVTPDEFPHYYNVAQAVAGPCLAAATNSPTLFGKRLWRETRVALFQQAVDTRSRNLYLREMSPRVHFGTGWVRDSVLEIYREDISSFRVILAAEEEDAFEVLDAGGVPKLLALQLHNGTVYRWNRACYGITEGKPHLRIENRILPAGPTVVDEMANAAFWFGLVAGLAAECPEITDAMDFDDAKSNFIAAARLGLGAHMMWMDERVSARTLICDTLLPIARRGLEASGIDASDSDRYLDLMRERVELKRTGAAWQLQSLARMRRTGESTRADRLNAVVAGMYRRQESGKPCHEWDLANLDEAVPLRQLRGTRVEHFMTTELFTVHEEELVELVARLMDWNRIRHVLVEDDQHQLVGLVTHRRLLPYVTTSSPRPAGSVGSSVKEIMIRDPISVEPDTATAEALQLMRDRQVSALPVVRDGHLMGIITESDFYKIAGKLLDDSMEQPAADDPD